MTKKEKVYIDVYYFENGNPFYFLGSWKNREKNYRAEITSSSGFFQEEYELEEFLEDNKNEIEIVEDYRE